MPFPDEVFASPIELLDRRIEEHIPTQPLLAIVKNTNTTGWYVEVRISGSSELATIRALSHVPVHMIRPGDTVAVQTSGGQMLVVGVVGGERRETYCTEEELRHAMAEIDLTLTQHNRGD